LSVLPPAQLRRRIDITGYHPRWPRPEWAALTSAKIPPPRGPSGGRSTRKTISGGNKTPAGVVEYQAAMAHQHRRQRLGVGGARDASEESRDCLGEARSEVSRRDARQRGSRCRKLNSDPANFLEVAGATPGRRDIFWSESPSNGSLTFKRQAQRSRHRQGPHLRATRDGKLQESNGTSVGCALLAGASLATKALSSVRFRP
jgi:hypothetical protein